MTCQWCINYRRRDGKVMCRNDDGTIRGIPPEVRPERCPRFDPRRICTTCGHGCSQNDKATRPFGDCPKWELRVLSTWGGNRRWPKKDDKKTKKSETESSTETENKEKEQ